VSRATVDQWITDAVPGQSFVDIGGLWGTVNERVTVAGRAGARSLLMLDKSLPESELWDRFRERCEELEVSDYTCLSGDLHERALTADLAPFGVVHCSGVLYHAARPLAALARLRELCAGTLILGSALVPPQISNAAGALETAPGSALFVPGLTLEQRQTIAVHFQEVGATVLHGLDTPVVWDQEDYAPWWWMFTEGALEGMLEVSGFSVRERCMVWGGRAIYFLADCVPVPTS
jgi:hypothetical protein